MTSSPVLTTPMDHRIAAAAILVALFSLPVEAQGPYIGFQPGVTLPSALTAPLTGNSQPTRCDSLLYPAGAAPDCAPSSPRQIYSTDFDLGVGYAGGVQLGYGWSWVRLEAEYLVHFQGSDSSPIYATADLVATGKGREWNVANPPFARVSDVRTHQLFANVYYDLHGLANDSRWTPFIGVGAGVARTSLTYSNRYVRKTLAQGFFPNQASVASAARPATSTSPCARPAAAACVSATRGAWAATP